MLVFALDACAPTHIKALPSAAPDALSGLDLLDKLLALGARFISTKGVYGEHVTMSLQGTLEQWTQQGKLSLVGVPSRRVKEVKNQVSKRLALPGRKDIALVCAALDANAVLLTHDSGCGDFGRALGLVTIDLVDVAMFLLHRGEVSRAGVEGVLAPLNSARAPFRPNDWAGSATATQLARVHAAPLFARLDGMLE